MARHRPPRTAALSPWGAGPFPSRLPILRCGQPFRRAGGRRARRRCRSSVRLSECRPARRRLLPSPRVAGQGLRCGHACPAPLQSLPQGPPALLRPARCPPPSWGRAWPFGPSLAQGVCPLAPAVGQHRTLGVGAAQSLRRTPSGSGHGRGPGLNPSGVGRSQAEPSCGSGLSPPEAHPTEVEQRTTSLQVPVRLRGQTGPSQKEVRDRENEAALGGMRNPRSSLRWVPGALAAGPRRGSARVVKTPHVAASSRCPARRGKGSFAGISARRRCSPCRRVLTAPCAASAREGPGPLVWEGEAIRALACSGGLPPGARGWPAPYPRGRRGPVASSNTFGFRARARTWP